MREYIESCIDITGYNLTEHDRTDKWSAIHSILQKEKKWELERKPVTQVVESWLRGLCSSVPVEYRDCEIEVLQKELSSPVNAERWWGDLSATIVDEWERRGLV